MKVDEGQFECSMIVFMLFIFQSFMDLDCSGVIFSRHVQNLSYILSCVQFRQLMKFFYRIAIFGIKVLREERIVVVAEQRPDCNENEVPMI